MIVAPVLTQAQLGAIGALTVSCADYRHAPAPRFHSPPPHRSRKPMLPPPRASAPCASCGR